MLAAAQPARLAPLAVDADGVLLVEALLAGGGGHDEHGHVVLVGGLARLLGHARHQLVELVLVAAARDQLHEVLHDEQRPAAGARLRIPLAHPLRHRAAARLARAAGERHDLADSSDLGKEPRPACL